MTRESPEEVARGDQEIPPKEFRLEEFYRRLDTAPPAANPDEAHALLSHLLNRLEDELTGVPFNPEAWASDGRLYPPQEDRRFEDGVPEGGRGYASRGHFTYIGRNGAIEIQSIRGVVKFRKPGRDGIRSVGMSMRIDKLA